MVSRADTFTANKRKSEFFSDFHNNFDKSPIGEQLARVTNERAVSQSIRNLIMTNLGERPFQPNIGSDVLASLFENISEPVLNILEYNIERVIQNYEPRANILQININSPLIDSSSDVVTVDSNEIIINIRYVLINNPDPIDLSIVLKKIR